MQVSEQIIQSPLLRGFLCRVWRWAEGHQDEVPRACTGKRPGKGKHIHCAGNCFFCLRFFLFSPQLTASVKYPIRGALEIALVSPAGEEEDKYMSKWQNVPVVVVSASVDSGVDVFCTVPVVDVVLPQVLQQCYSFGVCFKCQILPASIETLLLFLLI